MKKIFFILILILCLFITFFSLPKDKKFTQLEETAAEIVIPPVKLSDIFSAANEVEIPDDKKITIIATGDVLPARYVNIQVTNMNNYNWPYEKTADVLKSADITLINLETPLTKNCPLVSGGFKFCGDERNVDGLVFAGVDVVNLANNHTGNYGIDGVMNTRSVLTKNNILVSGIDGPAYSTVKGIRIAFLGYNDIGYEEDGVLWAHDERVSDEIKKAKEQSDLVIVSFHWGIEYTSLPSQRQKDLAHLAVDSGADLIIGNHPHWIQPVEIYQDKLITYSHGNFVFDQEWSLKTKQGVVGVYTFYGTKLASAKFLPIQINNYGQPVFLDSEKSKEILAEMYSNSMLLTAE